MSGDESSMNYAKIASYAVVLLVMVLISQTIIGQATSQEFREYMNDSEAWCEDHNGELYNSQSIFHGGLHCELENGTSVHMTKVIDYGG